MADRKPRIGIDLGGTKIEGIALDAAGATLARLRIATPRNDYEATVEAVAATVESLESRIGGQGTVGIGTPGSVSRATGRMKNANSVWLNGRSLGADLKRRLGRSVRLANDADCFALAEAVDGAAVGRRIVFGVILGTGVGGGIVVDGTLLAGPDGVTGEWGHNPLPSPGDDERPGPRCYCGRRGCLETFLSGPGLAEDHRRAGGEAISPEAVSALAEAGDTQARKTLDRHAERLARGLALVINILDPDAIVLGGGLSEMAHLYEEVPRRWGSFVFSDRVDTELLPPVHGAAGGVRGAARLWDERLSR